MIKLAIVAAVCLVGSIALVLDKPYYNLENAENMFQDFVQEHKKSYSRKEYFERLEMFKNSLKEINRLNISSGAVFVVNHFADLKPEELEQYRGLRPSNEKGVEVVVDSSLVLPPSHDWRDHNAVTHVKDQIYCGCCHIFSAIGNIEGQYAIKHKECLALSEQQALDCLMCGSCNGGRIHEVMQEFVNRSEADGSMSEKDYPYSANPYICLEDANKVVAHVTDGQILAIPDEDTLQKKLYEIGPLSVGLLATKTMHAYKSGIFDTVDDCAKGDINHGVVLVGYGEENGKKFWIIKNSWGEKWGEDGYIRLVRGVNACQMGTSYTASATVA